jgi:hypothetical protein
MLSKLKRGDDARTFGLVWASAAMACRPATNQTSLQGDEQADQTTVPAMGDEKNPEADISAFVGGMVACVHWRDGTATGQSTK